MDFEATQKPLPDRFEDKRNSTRLRARKAKRLALVLFLSGNAPALSAQDLPTFGKSFSPPTIGPGATTEN